MICALVTLVVSRYSNLLRAVDALDCILILLPDKSAAM